MKGGSKNNASQLSFVGNRNRQPTSLENRNGPIKVLVVDDSASSSLILKHFLEKGGECTVTVFNRPEIMAASIEFLEFDLAMIDIYMPKLDGPGLIELIRLHPRHKRTPIILISSDTSPDVYRITSETGAIGVLAKPIELKLFPEILAGVIHSNRNSTG